MTEITVEQASYVTERTRCAICDSSDLQPVLDFGDCFLVDFLDAPDPNYPKAPMELEVCPECHLFQLRHVVDRDKLYRNYWYRSGTSQTMRDHLKRLAQDAADRGSLVEGDVVLDIGSNDGTLLSNFPEDAKRYGFEPSPMVAGPEVAHDYFSKDNYHAYFTGTKAKLITSIAMFYDVAEPKQFVSDIRDVLAPDGLWVCEMNYMRDMLKNNAFDFVVHEHVNLYFLSTLNKVLRPEGLEVVDVSFNDINGGSARYYIAHKGYTTTRGSVDRALVREAPMRDLGVYEKFGENSLRVAQKLNRWVTEAAGSTVHLYGASTRGMTTIQFAGLDKIPLGLGACWEKDTAKVGKYIAGVGTPIISEEAGRQANPGHLLVLPWAYKKEFVKREAKYLEKGGRMVFPLPEPEVVTG